MKARGLEEYVCYVMWWCETPGTPSRIAKTAVDCCVCWPQCVNSRCTLKKTYFTRPSDGLLRHCRRGEE